ncbi:Phenylalanine tRNA synthetase like beta subunit [Fasciolopsis buskii]|uniref:Phenylalanine--tRNA ligase beta subunit n=1 Tax=Fasciolopsis buskii TaxID=27845 RepID=A0A8E0VJ83_9TREM|nr:Phenylalanine tRNA synthetase like beta subunit [Fasciolopsis buski]
MPIVSIPARTIIEKLGRAYGDEEFEELCFQYGLELDEITCEQELVAREKGQEKAMGCSAEKIYKVEVPANRYDILCTEGLSRALMIFKKEISVPVYRKLHRDPLISLHVSSSTQLVRPFVVAAILRNITLTDASFNSIIDLQEKLHQNICRKRSLVAIGTHDLDTIQSPFFYDAKTPSEIRFVPLNKDKVYTGAELMDLYATDSHLKAYLPLLKDKPVYPVITDKDGIVLSMPPIINGQHSRLSVNTRNIFIEATATDLHKAEIVLDTLVTMFSEYCDPPFTVEPVEVFQHDGSRHIFPRLSDRYKVVSINYINRILGTEFKIDEVIELLSRMGLETKPVNTDQIPASGGSLSAGSGLLSVRIPPTRHDILHACDIVEDVAIAYGYDNIPECMPHTYCIAQSQPLNRLTDLIRAEIAQQGFTEGLSFSLCSRDDISTKLRQDLSKIPAVHISNPKTSDFQVYKKLLVTVSTRTIGLNSRLSHPMLPHRDKDVVVKDASKDVGTRNNRRICAVYYSKQSGFEVIHGLLDRLMQVLSVRWKLDPEHADIPTDTGDHSTVLSYELQAAEDPTYFTGRCADVILSPGHRVIGRLGVIHPEVLRNFELTMPCSALDLDLEIFV